MDDSDDLNCSAAPLRALAGAAAAGGARELLLAGSDQRAPREQALTEVRSATGLPVVACGIHVPGLSLARMLLEGGAERVAARIDAPQADERLRALAEVYGPARTDALLMVRGVVPGDPGLAAAFGLTPRWEAAPLADGDASGAAGSGAGPVALARAARRAGVGRLLLQAACGGSPPAALLRAVEEASGLPVLLVEPAADGAPLYGVRDATRRPLPSSAA